MKPVLFFLLTLLSLSHYSRAQTPVVTLPTTQLLIDSLYQVQERLRYQAATTSVESERQQQVQQLTRVVQQQQVLLESILKLHGYPTPELVGPVSSVRYAILVGRCQEDRKFQQQVLKKLNPLVRQGSVEAMVFATLTDQVALAAGKPQVYGTQLRYQGNEKGRQLQQPALEPAQMNKRRAAIGLESIEEYLEKQTKYHRPSNQSAR